MLRTKLAADDYIDAIISQFGLVDTSDQDKQIVDLLRFLIVNSFNSNIAVPKKDVMQQLSLNNQGFDKLLACQAIRQVPSNDALIGDTLSLISFDEGGELFYLTRYWQIRQRLFSFLISKPENSALSNKEQANCSEDVKRAWKISQQKGWLVIQGGAGTGKTTLALNLLCQLLKQNSKPVSLVALTGKATSRLSDSINNDPSLKVLKNDLVECSTIHRLLEKKMGSRTRFGSRNYLPHGIIFIDEASMVTWDLLDELLSAVHPQTIIVFLGDKNQLQSIGVGGFLGELTQSFPESSLSLIKQHRFSKQSEIHRLAKLALEGQLLSSSLPVPHCLNADIDKQDSMLKDWCQKKWLNPIKKIASMPNITSSHPLFNELLQSVILNPWRFYRFGVYELSRTIQGFLYRNNALAKADGLCVGIPVILRKNLHDQKLFNGDRGVVVGTQNSLQVLFSGQVSPTVVAEQDVDVAFVMTIHQTQGSEFDSVLLWFGKVEPLAMQWLSPNLLYTAITRAKKELLICGDTTND